MYITDAHRLAMNDILIQEKKYLEQLNTLYQQRELAAAKQLLEQSNIVSSFSSQLLKAKIYNTTVYYSGDRSLYETIATTLVEATVFIETIEQQIAWNLEKGKLALYEGDYTTAQNLFQQAQKLSQKKKCDLSFLKSKLASCNVYLAKNNFYEAQQIAKESLTLLNNCSQEEPYNRLRAKVFNLLGRIYIKRQDYTEVLRMSSSALKLSRAYKAIDEELIALNNLAVGHGINSAYKEAMNYLLEALELARKVQHRKQIARCQSNIGSIYAHLFNYTEALRRYEIVLTEYEDIIDASTKVHLFNNVGNLWFTQNESAKASSYFEKAYEAAKQINYREMQAMSLAQLGRCAQTIGKSELAILKTNAADQFFHKVGTVNGRQINSITQGKLAYQNKNYTEAIRLISKGVFFAKQLKDDLTQIKGYHLLSKIYQEKNDLAQAYRYLNVYTSYREEYSKIQRNRQLLDLEIQHGIQEKQKEIERLRIENQYQAQLLEQANEIKAKNEALSEVNEELKQFAYVASHDLKEPLRMIGNFSQIIYRTHQANFDEQSKEYYHYITEGVQRMNALLDGLLKYATIGKSDQPDELHQLNEILDICQLYLRQTIAETQAVIIIDELPAIWSDQSLLIQLFQNLLSNAIKFRQKDKHPHIHIFATEEKDHFTIHVKDNGIGIPEEQQERIFAIFQRLHKRTEYEGTGIGLAVCQKIVKRLGSVLQLNSKVGEGTTFYFNLPKTKLK